MKIFTTVWLLFCILVIQGNSSSVSAQRIISVRESNSDITEESFWTENSVTFVRIKIAGLNKNAHSKITADIVQPITGEPSVALQESVLDNYYCLDWDRHAERNGVVLHPGEIVAVYRSINPDPHTGTPPRAYITRLNQGLESGLAKALITILHIRNDGNTPNMLMQNVFCNDPLAASYCAKQLLSKPINQSVNDSIFVGRLCELRNNENTDINLRILVSHLANRVKTSDILGGDDYKWGKEAVATSQKLDAYQLNNLVVELASFPEKRKETVSFLINLIQNPNVRKAIRFAACGNLYDKPLFNTSQSDDALNENIVNSYISQLKDKDSMFRLVAVDGLNTLCNRISASPGASTITYRVKNAIEEANETEKDDVVAKRMQITLFRMRDARFYAQ